jgi:hypothetical protein
MTSSRGHPAGEVQLRYRRADGGFADTTLERVVVDDPVAGTRCREPRSGRVASSDVPGDKMDENLHLV